MNTQWISGAWFPMFVDLCLQGTIVLFLATLTLRACRRRSAAHRHLAAATALGVLLLLPALLLVPPLHPVTTATPPRRSLQQIPPATPGMRTPNREPTSFAVPKHSPAARRAAASNPVEPGHDAIKAASSPPVRVTASVSGFDSGLSIWIFGVWLSGCLVLAARLIGGYLHLFVLARRCRAVADEQLHATVLDVARVAGFRRGISLLQGTRATPVNVPVTWGAWQHVVLLPEDAGEWPEARLRAVLLHELAHIRRGDWVAQTVAQIACCLFWFHPIAWALQHCMQEEAERACDDAVLGSGVAPTEYAVHLLEVVRAVRSSRVPAASVSMARDPQVTVRMRSILEPRRRTPASRGTFLGAAGAAAAILLPVACLRPLAAQNAASTSDHQPGNATLQSVSVLSCILPVTGPGVEVTLSDSNLRGAKGADDAMLLIHDRDIALVVNALKSAGAEAVSVGDQRLSATTAIRASGDGITVNSVKVHAPFMIRAIGNSDALLGVLNLPRGVMANLRRADPGMARAVKLTVMEVPGLTAGIGRKWAHYAPATAPDGAPDFAALRYLRALAGMTDVTGPGIVVTLSDSRRQPGAGEHPETFVIHDRDVAAVVEQLRAAGAEAISVGDQRVAATTAVSAAASGLRVNAARVVPPVVLRAIGDPDALYRALNRPNDVLDGIRRVDPGMVRVEESSSVRLAAYSGAAPRYAHTTTPLAFQQPRDGGPSGQVVTAGDGVGVELIAVGSSPSGMGNDWWRPDGAPLAETPVRTNNRFHNSYTGVGTQYLSRSLFFRIHSQADVVASTTGYIVDPAHRLDTDGYHHGRDMRLNDTHLLPEVNASGAVILGFPKSETRCTYRFGIATGPWETVSVTRLPLHPAARLTRPLPEGREYSPVIALNASPVIAYQDSLGKDHIQSLLAGHAPLGDVARRVVALDRDGREVAIDDGGLDYRGEQSLTVSASVMARIAEFRLQVRPYEWAEFRDIALQPKGAPASASIAMPSPLPGFQHRFACGMILSLPGVTERKVDGGRWWLPNGSSLAGPIKAFASAVTFEGLRADDHPHAILMHQSSSRDLSFSEAWQLLPDARGWNGVQHIDADSGLLRNQPFASAFTVVYPPGVRRCTVRFGVAAGTWQTVGAVPMPQNIRHKEADPKSYTGDLSCVLSDRPELDYTATDGQPHSLQFLQSGRGLGNVARRIVAVDNTGKVHLLNATLNGTRRIDGTDMPTDFIELTFADSGILHRSNAIDLASVKEFRLQTRPYEWAEFKGVHLEPGP